MTTKSVGWSYPSSPNAKRFGYYKTGCWEVSTQTIPSPPVYLEGFSTKEAAIEFARSLPEPWSQTCLDYNPDIAP